MLQRLTLLLLATAWTIEAAHRFLKVEFDREEDRRVEEAFARSAAGSIELTPPVSELNLTGVDVDGKDSHHRVSVSVVIENYSMFSLVDARTSGAANCGRNREIRAASSIGPGHRGTFSADNSALWSYNSCGAVTWQIADAEGHAVRANGDDPTVGLGRRLVVTYKVDYSGSCDSEDRLNTFSVNVWHTPLNASGYWTQTDLVEGYFSVDHTDTATSSYGVSVPLPALALFDSGRFLVRAQMESGCSPVLTIAFFPGSKYKDMLFSKQKEEVVLEKIRLKEEAMTTNSSQPSSLFSTSESMPSPFQMAGTLALVAVVTAGVVMAVCAAVNVIKQKRAARTSPFADTPEQNTL